MGNIVVMPAPVATKPEPERFAFTEQRLAKLDRPASGPNYVYDTDESGLCVRITPSSSSYVFYRWHNGKPGRITIARVGELPLRKSAGDRCRLSWRFGARRGRVRRSAEGQECAKAGHASRCLCLAYRPTRYATLDTPGLREPVAAGSVQDQGACCGGNRHDGTGQAAC